MSTLTQQPEVIVLGAGMAGLTAARALAERGVRVQVLEAQQRVGGRVLSRLVDGAEVELGAEFVHGRPPELWALIDEAGLTTVERDGTTLRTLNGSLAQDDPQDGAMFDTLEELRSYQGPDQSFAAFVASKSMSPEVCAALKGYVEGFNAADASVIGIRGLGAQQTAEDSIDGGRIWHIRGGYAQLAEYLAQQIGELGGQVQLGAEVSRIEWKPGSVQLTTSSGLAYSAMQCIVTLPLGVLRRVNDGGLVLLPEPAPIAAARRLAMGEVVRFTMVFRRCWWRDATLALSPEKRSELSFLFTPDAMPPVWWTPHPEPGPAMLTGWVGGPRSTALARHTAEQLGADACRTLAKVFGMPEEAVARELISTHTHDWNADPFSRGAYSYVPAGALNAPRAMTEPVERTLFFAGEHTDVTGHWGTVHAAMRSGIRAAQQVLGKTGI